MNSLTSPSKNLLAHPLVSLTVESPSSLMTTEHPVSTKEDQSVVDDDALGESVSVEMDIDKMPCENLNSIRSTI